MTLEEIDRLRKLQDRFMSANTDDEVAAAGCAFSVEMVKESDELLAAAERGVRLERLYQACLGVRAASGANPADDGYVERVTVAMNARSAAIAALEGGA